jgi:hypothetical protein
LLTTSALLMTVLILAPAASAAPSLDVYVGYADSERGNAANFPTPWDNPSNSQITFEGCRPASGCTFDGGAVRLVNSSSSSVTVNSVKVQYSAACVYDIWPHDITLAAGRQLILAQTKTTTSSSPAGCTSSASPGAPGYGILDGSDIGPNGQSWDGTCTQSGVIPQVQVAVNGSAATTFADTGQVLNTRGSDAAWCPSAGPGVSRNESIQWTSVGAVPCLGAALTLGPSNQSAPRGGVATVSANLTDGCSHALQGAVVSFRVAGASAPGSGQGGSTTTNAQGNAAFSYADIASAVGTDKVQASVKNPSGTFSSNSVSVNWVGGPGGPGSGGSPRQIGNITGLSLRPSSFRPASSGPSMVAVSGQRKFGAVVTYHDSHPAIASFTVFKPVSGQQRGKSCVAPGRGRSHAKPCTRLVVVGFFTHTDIAGKNRFRFTGRVRGHKLSASTYVLQVVPHSSAGAGRMRSKSFRITPG